MKRKLQYKRSGKPTSQHWLYPGPFGKEGNVASTLFQESIHAPPNSGFSVTGAHRNVGRVGKHMMMSQSGTPFKGVHPRGWGGKNGRYPSGPNNQVLNVPPLLFVQSNIVKPPVLSSTADFAGFIRVNIPIIGYNPFILEIKRIPPVKVFTFITKPSHK
jgi:hypothetical protein